MVGDPLGGSVGLGRRLEPALGQKLGQQLAVVDHLVAAPELGVLVGDGIEAMGTLGDHPCDPDLTEGGDVLQGAVGTRAHSRRRAGSPVQASRDPRMAKSMPAR